LPDCPFLSLDSSFQSPNSITRLPNYPITRFKLLAVAVIGAAAVLLFVSAPPARILLRGAAEDGTIPGVLHVHSNRSDGRGSHDEIAVAASRAGLKFVVFADHGDGTRPPEPPAYRAGVLCIDGVEISTNGGHYVALGMPASPYPLGGEARDVVEDVRRLGGIGIVSHPDSPKADLRWSDWDAPIDGMEILNLDTGWRVQASQPGFGSKLRLLGAFGAYPFMPEETIGSLLNDPALLVDRWVSLAGRRRVAGLAGADAHAKLALWDVEPGDNRFTLPLPGYESSFRTISTHVRLEQPLSGDAAADAALVLAALRDGRLYTVVDALATPPSFEFSATAREKTVHQGGELPADGPVRLRVRSNAPSGFTATVWEGSRVLAADRQDGDFTLLAPEGPAVYRVEIRATNRPGRPLWILSNPIYVGLRAKVTDDVWEAEEWSGPSLFPSDPFGWSTESDSSSNVDLDVEGDDMRLRYSIGSDPTVHPRVAIAAPPRPLVPHDRVSVTMRADRPMRVSVQLRLDDMNRWQRSVYVDTAERDVTIRFDDMKAVGTTRGEKAPIAESPSLMLVIDTTNTRPGASGQLRIRRVVLGHAGGAPARPGPS
jgi:hypothetical protein